MIESSSNGVTLVVSYQGTSKTRFDRSYYVDVHLPLVMNAWGRYGLEKLAALFPAVEQPGTIALCECRFRDEAAIAAAFNAPETAAVMADVSRFTDATPARACLVAL